MIGIAYLKRLFGAGSDAEDENGLEKLQAYLERQAATLNLVARYEEPTLDTRGEPTAVFPMTLYHDGEVYAKHSKEFPIPDDGLDDESAPLTAFLRAHNIQSVADIGAIEGAEANARLLDNGEVEVEY